MEHPLFLPMFVHMIWTVVLYVVLTLLRAPAVWGVGRRKHYENTLTDIEKRTSANLSNQFEWPMFFYVIGVIVLASEVVNSVWYVGLAWVFVAGRIVHSGVQILTTNIRLRGLVFSVNFSAVLGMWLMYCVHYLNT
ncbi:MAPEG family protein [Teredinibacter purpureus]|uniref:MAPEG family protein n=1 Tax=Teredinibacter purpureus TaxID=2731756 RepID=UPI0005F7A890|nr:MAPEG family protein [Teredinibacter purpureus]